MCANSSDNGGFFKQDSRIYQAREIRSMLEVLSLAIAASYFVLPKWVLVTM
ncbi:hypothetical protein [Nostoc sp.]|uniref:hypothetical protein n=1 Tax=Nostoc sp. TaxID=1180 RepID=UPI002FFB4FD0